MTLSPQPTHLGQLMESLYRLFEGSALKKQLDYRLVIDVTRPAVIIDALRLSQIISNLLSNAVKYTDQGSVHVLVRDLPDAVGQSRCAYEIQISDTGIGLSEAEQRDIFEPFMQAGDCAQRRGGSELGLIICSRLARMLDMELRIESRRGLGSCFTVRFQAELAEVAPVDAPRCPVAAAPNRLKILVVEDHAPNRLMLCQQLEYLGYEAVPCEDGEAARMLWSTSDPCFDLTITDCNMPNMDGYELTRQLRELEFERASANHPIFGLTASAQTEITERCLEAGMTRCLFKPLSIDTLAPLIAEVAQRVERRSLAACADSELDKIRILKPEAYVPLVQQMLRASQEDGEQLMQMLLQENPMGLGRLAHKIKGGAQLANDRDLISACKVLEALAEKGSWVQRRRGVDGVLACLDRLKVRLGCDS